MSRSLKYKGYLGQIDFSTQDNLLFGKIIGISDLVSYEGETLKDLKAAFQKAVDDYILTCKQLGKEPEKVYTGSFNVRVPSNLHKEATILALENDMTLNEVIRTALSYFVSHKEEANNEIQMRKAG